jgi:DNA-directed RNA polymerase specialized sigma24 family protein
MRVPWDRTREVLVGSLRTLHAAQEFRVARKETPVLEEFPDANALVDYLTDENGGEAQRDHKDRIYAALVRAVQSRVAWARLAHTILLLGLWHSFDRLYVGHRRYFRDAAELAQAIPVAFAILVGRLDLDRVDRVAATLVRSTLRDVMRELRRDEREMDRTAQSSLRGLPGLPDLDEGVGDAMDVEDASAPQGLSHEGELRLLHARFHRRLGPDAELVLGVFVLGETQHELADRLGVSHDRARKRFQHACEVVRLYLCQEVPLSEH